MVIENYLSIRKKQKQAHFKKQMLLPMITMIVVLTITFFVSIAKGCVKEVYASGLPEVRGKLIRLNEKGLNLSEISILRTLYRVLDISDLSLEEDSSTGAIYFIQLKKQLCREGIDIEKPVASKIIGLIEDINRIMIMEKIREPEKMSIDGREVATYIAKQIYKLCGLNLTYNMEGEIIGITDLSGEEFYSRNQTIPDKINLYALAITLSSITVLMIICVIISKKNQLFIKDVKYDGFKEKRFAQ